MKKIKLTESDLTRVIEKVIKEQEEETEDEYQEEHSSEVDILNQRIDDLETQLHELQDEYSRKIGFGDHHVISHGH